MLAVEDVSTISAGPHMGKKIARAMSSQRRTRASPVELCVADVFFQWYEFGQQRPRAFGLCLPPEAIPSSSSRCLWDRFRNLEYLEPVRAFKAELLDRAAQSGGMPVDFENTDNASGNDLYFSACENVDMLAHPTWIKARVLCFNHSNQHTVVWLIASVLSVALVSKMAAVAQFLSMGTHMLRLVLHVGVWARQLDRVELREGSPPPCERLFAAEAIDYICANHMGSVQQKESLTIRLESLFQVWNAGFFRHDGRLVFYVPSISSANKDALLQQRSSFYQAVVLSRSPCRPSLSKWTPWELRWIGSFLH